MPKTIGEKRRIEILADTGKVIRERGFANTRLVDVATEAGVSPPLILYHFGTKDKLFAAALDHAVHAELDRMDEIVELDLSATEKLDHLLVMSIGESSRADWALWVDAWGEALRSDDMWDQFNLLDERWERSVRTVIAQGVATGEFTVSDVDHSAAYIAVLLDGLGVRSALEREDKPTKDLLGFARRAVGREVGATLGTGRRARR